MLLAVMSILWTWPLVLHLQDHIPGLPGDNYSFLWNLWWMRKALSAPELDFFHSQYLFSPFGVDLINQLQPPSQTKGSTMPDKSPQRPAGKKAGKSLKQKRADKKAAAASKDIRTVIPPNRPAK